MLNRRQAIRLFAQMLFFGEASKTASGGQALKPQTSRGKSRMQILELIVEHDKEDAETAQIFVDGAIGSHAYRFLLDTGAARTSVLHDAYTSKFDVIGKTSSSAVFVQTHSELVVVPSVKIGPLVKTNLAAARVAAGEAGVLNLIGMDFIKDYSCHFLFDEKRVQVGPDSKPGASHALQELFLDKTFHPYVNVHFGERQGKAVWDTGAGITVADMKFIKDHPDCFQEAGRTYGTDAAGHKQETPLYIMAASSIGDHIFPPHKIAGVDLSGANATLEVPMDLILGYTTLSKAHWYFDFPHKKWAVTKLLIAGSAG